MKLALLSCLFSAALLSVACGSSPKPRVIDGAWNASLKNSDSSSAYTFITTLNQNTGSKVDVSGFLFMDSAPCFPSQTGQTATFSATGHSKGFQTGPFTMVISTTFGTQVENVLTLSGIRNSDGTITGTWTLTGLTGCSGDGTYAMRALPLL